MERAFAEHRLQVGYSLALRCVPEVSVPVPVCPPRRAMRLVSARDWARGGGAIGRPGRRAAGVMAAAAGLLLVAGCHAFGTSSYASAPTASGTVTVVAAPGVADAPLYIGVKDGFFRQVGLTVRVVSTESVRSEVAALASGSANIAFGDYADMFFAQERSPSAGHLEIVANGYDAAPST